MLDEGYSFPVGSDGLKKFAVIVVDMWDKHWCRVATDRVKELAPAVQQFVAVARSRGALIIHAPSECMNFYKNGNYKAYQWGVGLNDSTIPVPSVDVPRWDLPLSLNNGGCPAGGLDAPVDTAVWTKEIDAISIDDNFDLISQSQAQMYRAIVGQGRDSVILVGVHLNQCMLWTRSFSLFFWAGVQRMGKLNEVMFARDLTDTMYASADAPFIDHFAGNDLMTRFIRESLPNVRAIRSSDLLGIIGSTSPRKVMAPFCFAADQRKRVALPQRVHLRCAAGTSDSRYLCVTSGGSVGLVKGPVNAQTSTWTLEEIGPGICCIRADVNNGVSYYLDGDPNRRGVAVRDRSSGFTGTKWILTERDETSNTFSLHCCGKVGAFNCLSGNAALDGVIMSQSADELLSQWVVSVAE